MSTKAKLVTLLIVALNLFVFFPIIRDYIQNEDRASSRPTVTGGIQPYEDCLLLKRQYLSTATAVANLGEEVSGTLSENTVEFTGPNSLIRHVKLVEFPNRNFYVEASGRGNEVNSTLDITLSGTKVSLIVKEDEIKHVLLIPPC